MYTSHGHHIPGTDPASGSYIGMLKMRCGGPGLCEKCSQEAVFAQTNKGKPDMVDTTIYTRKPFEVEALQVTEENMEAASQWCHGDIMTEGSDEHPRNFIKVRVARPLNERQTKAYVGDWILYAGTGFKVYTNKAFHKTFEKLDGVAKDNATQATKGTLTVEEGIDPRTHGLSKEVT